MVQLKTFALILGTMVLCGASRGLGETRHESKPSSAPHLEQGKKEKVYLLDEKPFSPIQIIDAKPSRLNGQRKVTVLRDPGHTFGSEVQKPRAPVVNRSTAVVKQPAKVVQKPFRFRKVTVKGYHSDPRVEFSQDQLDLGRSDEPLQAHFLPRTFEEERDL